MTSIDADATVQEALREWPDMGEDFVRAALAGAQPCATHRARPRNLCVPCCVERRQAADAQAVAEQRAAAHADLDRRLPARFRCATVTNADVLGWCRRFLADPTTAGNLVLGGPTSSGKTHQAAGVVRHVIPVTVRMTGLAGSDAMRPTVATWAFWNMGALANALRPGGDVDARKVLAECGTVGLLVLDDVGVARMSEWAEECLYVIVNARYEDMRPTVITTNLAPGEYRKMLGERITSRLGQDATRAILAEHDYRAHPVTPPAVCPAHGVAHSRAGGAQ